MNKMEKAINEAIVPVDEQAYKIPLNWQWTYLGSVGDVNPRHKNIPDDTIVSFVPMASVDEKVGEYLEKEEKIWSGVKKGYTHMADNDVIFAKITPCMENGKSAVIKNLKNGYGAGSTEFHVFRSYGKIIPEYLHAFLRQESFRKYAEKNMTGSAGQKRVPTKWFKKVHFPLPPIEEQRRIVNKLKKLFEIIDKAEYEIIKSKELSRKRYEAVLRKAFRGELVPKENGNFTASELIARIEVEKNKHSKTKENVRLSKVEHLNEIPSHWVWVNLSEIIQFIKSGISRKFEKEDIGYPVIRSGNIQGGKLSLNDIKYWYKNDPKKTDLSKLLLTKGDILVNFINSIAQIGKACIFDVDDREYIYTTNIFRILPHKELLDSKFFILFTHTDIYRNKIREILKPAVNQASITQKDFLSIPFPLPPIEEQREIVRHMEQELGKHEELFNYLGSCLENLRKLRQSLLQQAFSGKLVEQKLEEGTGIDLLKEIIGC